MPQYRQRIKGAQVEWGKTTKGFIQYLVRAGETVSKSAQKKLAAGCQEFLDNEDWDWPRGARFTAMNLNTGQTFRASGTYASGFRGGDKTHPWYTGNLHDSMAAGVMEGTRIIAASYMRPGAYILQEYEGQIVDGVTAGQDALMRAAHTFGHGGKLGSTLRAVLTIGVPYAEKVNEMSKHEGYVEYLTDAFSGTMYGVILELPKASFKMK